MDAYKNLADIQAETIKRASTGFQELDWMYGCTEIDGKIYWGIPCHKISLWSGISGVGKSRAAVQLAKSLVNLGYRVLYFQSEESLPSFAAKIKADYESSKGKFLCSDSTDLQSQIDAIKEVCPDFVFVDSINEMDDYNYGTKRDIKCIFDGYRQITKTIPCHVIFLTQLNHDGSIKGSTTLAHLADIALNLVPCDKRGSSLFEIRIGRKHRYGRQNPRIYSRWEHTADGIKCISDYSLEDELWCKTHGIPVRNIREYYESLGLTPYEGQTVKIFQNSSQEEDKPKSGWLKDLRILFFGR
jgi:predicted ATP-dependent serine protease